MSTLPQETPAPVKANNTRDGNLELLRVVCMLLILAHHLAYHGQAVNANIRENKVLAYLMFSGGQTGVNCFVLITGYYLTSFRVRRIAATALETLFYSVGITLALKWTGLRPNISDQYIKDCFFVISRTPYWFVVMYLGLNALLPLLAPAVKKLNRNAHKWALLFGAVYMSLIPTLTFRNPSSMYFSQLGWFVFLYCLGAYFRKYPNSFTKNLPMTALTWVAMAVMMTLLMVWGEGHQDLFQKVPGKQNFLQDRNSFFQLVCSCCLFLTFANLKVKPCKALTLLSGASFGVYLIHDHGMLRSLLWGNWVRVQQVCQTNSFVFTALIAPPIIYLACAAVDTLRRYALEQPLMKLMNPVFDRIDGWVGK